MCQSCAEEVGISFERDLKQCYRGQRLSENQDVTPRLIFNKVRPVSYALRSKVEEELNRLEKHDIITCVEFSELTGQPLSSPW